MSAVTDTFGVACDIDENRRVFVGKIDTPDGDTFVIDFENKNYPEIPTHGCTCLVRH